MKGFQEQADIALVETALVTLQLLLVSKPPALFDPYTALAVLEHLVNSAREVGHERAKRYAVILRQCCPLVHNLAMQSVLIKLQPWSKHHGTVMEIKSENALFMLNSESTS